MPENVASGSDKRMRKIEGIEGKSLRNSSIKIHTNYVIEFQRADIIVSGL